MRNRTFLGVAAIAAAMHDLSGYDSFPNSEAPRIVGTLSQEYWRTTPTGERPSTGPLVRKEGKIGRNDGCPCGSARKYKKCCLNK